MTKLLADMTRSHREKVVNRLKQEARYRIAVANEVAEGNQQRKVLLDWLFGPAAYSIEEFHRRVAEEELEAAHP